MTPPIPRWVAWAHQGGYASEVFPDVAERYWKHVTDPADDRYDPIAGNHAEGWFVYLQRVAGRPNAVIAIADRRRFYTPPPGPREDFPFCPVELWNATVNRPPAVDNPDANAVYGAAA